VAEGDSPRHATFLKMLDDLHARHLVGVADVREVWLIRHADAYVGLESLNEGVLDPPLSGLGLDQAARLARRLSEVPIGAVWSSSLRRATETAEAVARPHGLGVRQDERLREVRTDWDEGRSGSLKDPGVYPFLEPESEVVEHPEKGCVTLLWKLSHGAPPGGSPGSSPRWQRLRSPSWLPGPRPPRPRAC